MSRADRSGGRILVVGAGLAGLAAASVLRERGSEVRVLEASPHLGGRCRSYVDPEFGLLDNGTHALTAANPVALAFLRRLGALERWHAPEGGKLPLVDVAERRVFTLRPRLRDFWALGFRPAHLLALLGRDRPIETLFDSASPGYRRIIEPLTLAVLNTHPREASSALMRRVFREAWRGPAAFIPLVAEAGLGPDLVEPLADSIRDAGASIETGIRIRRLLIEEGRVASLDLGDEVVRLGAGDAVILAVPAPEAERLTGLSFGFGYSPIVNAHFALGAPMPGPARMVGVLGAATQWVLLRGNHASVTVSAADDIVGLSTDELGNRLWPEVRAVLDLLGLAPPGAPRAQRIIKERRATIRQTPGLSRPGPRTAWPNLVLAGDWTGTGLPATIEGALRSGLAAARAVARAAR